MASKARIDQTWLARVLTLLADSSGRKVLRADMSGWEQDQIGDSLVNGEYSYAARLRMGLAFIVLSDDYGDLFSTTHLPAAKRLAIAVLLDDPGAGNALADYLMEIGVVPDGLHVERERIVKLLEDAGRHYLNGRMNSRQSDQNQWFSGAERAIADVLRAVTKGDEVSPAGND